MAFNTKGSLMVVWVEGTEREKCGQAERDDHGEDGPAAFWILELTYLFKCPLKVPRNNGKTISEIWEVE